MKKLKIAVLCSGAPHHKFLIHNLCLNFNVVSIIIEPNECKINKLLSRKKYIDYIANIYHELRRSVTGLTAYRKKFFEIENPIFPLDKVMMVDSINSERAVNNLKNSNPDLIVVMSTSIIKEDVLKITDNIINIHGGYLPYYKGNHCFFFAYINKDWKKIGSTIHFINNGIDEGDIIEHVRPDKITYRDTPESLYCKCDKKAILRLVQIIKDYEKGIDFKRQKQEKVGKLYYTRDRHLWHEFKYFLIKLSMFFYYKK